MTSERVVTERAILTKTLKLYKNSPCLWDLANKDYFNKKVRQEAYENLLTVWRRLEPDSTVPTIKKKIEHLRSTYRRERKKVENSVLNSDNSNDVYKPKLWYYELMTFLNRDTHTCDDKFSDEEEEQEEIIISPKKKKRRSIKVDAIKKYATQKQQDMEKSESKWDQPSYETTYGLTIAKQLKELDEHVRYEAERIISDVIYRARMGTLVKYSPQSVEAFFIPQSGPSWYDVSHTPDSQRPVECSVISKNENNDVEES